MIEVGKKKTLSVSETARVLGISRPTVYGLIHADGFPAFKVGSRTLISVDGLDRWIEAQMGEEARQ